MNSVWQAVRNYHESLLGFLHETNETNYWQKTRKTDAYKHKLISWKFTVVFILWLFQTWELPKWQTHTAACLLIICCCHRGVYRQWCLTDTSNVELHACLSGKLSACAWAKYLVCYSVIFVCYVCGIWCAFIYIKSNVVHAVYIFPFCCYFMFVFLSKITI